MYVFILFFLITAAVTKLRAGLAYQRNIIREYMVYVQAIARVGATK